MNDEIVTLIWPLDEEAEEKTEAFAEVESISQSEFFAAAQNGYKAQYKISIWDSDYSKQPLVEIGGVRYSVYRTYRRADGKIELYLTDKIGV